MRPLLTSLRSLLSLPLAVLALGGASAVATPAGSRAGVSVERDRNVAVVRRFFDEGLRPDRYERVLDEIVAPDVMNHASGKPGLVAFKALIGRLIAEAPDQRYEILSLVADGDMVVVRTERTGTARLDAFRGYAVKPGQSFRTIHAHFFQVRDGRIVAHWGVRDDLGMAQQLGAIPLPPTKR